MLMHIHQHRVSHIIALRAIPPGIAPQHPPGDIARDVPTIALAFEMAKYENGIFWGMISIFFGKIVISWQLGIS